MTDTDNATGTEVATATDPAAAMDKFRAHIAKLTERSTDDTRERMITAILSAATPEDTLNAGSSIPAKTIDGVPIVVTGIRADESGFEDGGDFYLHVDAMYASNGRTFTFSTGAADVVAKLVKYDMEGWFPVRCVIEVAKKPTRDNFYPVFLRPIDEDDEPF